MKNEITIKIDYPGEIDNEVLTINKVYSKNDIKIIYDTHETENDEPFKYLYIVSRKGLMLPTFYVKAPNLFLLLTTNVKLEELC